jgi:hypothetical protein
VLPAPLTALGGQALDIVAQAFFRDTPSWTLSEEEQDDVNWLKEA